MSYIFGSDSSVKTYIFNLDLGFCLFKFICLSSYLAENLYFWINLAYNEEELNEKILNRQFPRPC